MHKEGDHQSQEAACCEACYQHLGLDPSVENDTDIETVGILLASVISIFHPVCPLADGILNMTRRTPAALIKLLTVRSQVANEGRSLRRLITAVITRRTLDRTPVSRLLWKASNVREADETGD